MTRQEVIDELDYYNRWRKDVHLKMPDMIKVWEATETAIRLLIEDQKIIDFYEKI